MRQNAAASNLPTAVAATNIAYDAANELIRWNSATTNLAYDANGNLATETQGGVTTTYTWDSRNRLTGLSRTGLTASFVYDGLGRRKSKTINGTTTGFWYDGSDVYAELTGTTPSATYIRGLSLDEPYIRKGVSDEFYETDALGSAVALTNAAGTSQTTYTYEPFGNTIQTGTASPNAFQYTGRENDGTGLYSYRARYYHPKMQRFMSEDPIQFFGGDTNTFAYVFNRPLYQVDPWGLAPGQPFKAEHEAARDAIDDVCSKPLKKQKWEWGGYIQRDSNGNYYASKPRTDSKTGSVDVRAPGDSSTLTVTSLYHTHARVRSPESSGSGDDFTHPFDYKDDRTGDWFPNYLGLPDCKRIKMYRPDIGDVPIR